MTGQRAHSAKQRAERATKERSAEKAGQCSYGRRGSKTDPQEMVHGVTEIRRSGDQRDEDENAKDHRRESHSPEPAQDRSRNGSSRADHRGMAGFAGYSDGGC